MATSKEIEPLTGEQMVELSKVNGQLSDVDLRGIQDYEDAQSLINDEYGGTVDISDVLGNGFSVLPNSEKSKLVGKGFAIVGWSFNPGDFGPFVSAIIVTQDGGKFRINDGSTGVYQQLLDFSNEHKRFGGITVPHGLRVSQYDTCAECNRPRRKDDAVCATCGDETDRRSRGETYYLDTSA